MSNKVDLSCRNKIGGLPVLGLIWDVKSAAVYTITVMLSFFAIQIIRWAVETRFVGASQDNLSFFIGELFGIPLAMVAAAELVYIIPSREGRSKWYTSTAWHVGCLGFSVALGVIVALIEYSKGVYVASEILSPSKLWHNIVIYGVLGYWLLTGAIPGLLYGESWGDKGLYVFLLFLGLAIWIVSAFIDTGPKPLAHEPFTWW